MFKKLAVLILLLIVASGCKGDPTLDFEIKLENGTIYQCECGMPQKGMFGSCDEENRNFYLKNVQFKKIEDAGHNNWACYGGYIG